MSKAKQEEPVEEGATKLSKEEVRAVRDRTVQLVDEVNKTYYDLGANLSFIAHNGLYGAWKFDTFEAYVESELGFTRRKAYYLIAIYDRAVEIEAEPEKLEQIGWTKAKEILSFVENKKDFDKWVKRAVSMSVSELQEAIRLALGAEPKKKTDTDGNKTFAGEDGEVFHELKTILSDAQYDNVKVALVRAADIAHSDKAGHLLDLICLEFLANNGPEITNIGEKLAEWAKREFIELDAAALEASEGGEGVRGDDTELVAD